MHNIGNALNTCRRELKCFRQKDADQMLKQINIDDILKRYSSIQKSDRSDLIAVLGHDTQCGDDQHVFNDFSKESSARFLRRIIWPHEIVVSELFTAFQDFSTLTGQEYAIWL